MVEEGSCLIPQREHFKPSSKVGTFFIPHTLQIQLLSFPLPPVGVTVVEGGDTPPLGGFESGGGLLECKRRVIFGEDLRNPVQYSV